MNRQQKEVQQAFLNSEKDVLKKLERNYSDAINEIETRIAILQGRKDADLQHVIYQIEYQKALKEQVNTILEQLHNNNFETLSEYLTASYEDGFLGTLYDLQGQGIPLMFPIDQEQIVAAIQHETKLSESLYAALGKDTKVLSKQIAGEISRGITNSAMYSEMARNISSYCGISKNKAMRIARTEAHRIQCKATADVQKKAKAKGADIVKQWDSSLDGKTREHHRMLDGQIKELEEPFEVAGMEAMQPGGFGIASEDCNCRCALLQRARWALGNEYTKWSPDAPVLIDDNGTTQLLQVKAKDFTEFKGYYKDITGQMTMNLENSGVNRVRSSVRKMKSLEKSGKGDIIKTTTVKDAIDAGTVSTKINVDKQNRHIVGSEGYIEGRSYLKGNIEDAQKLVDELNGTGKPIVDSKGKWTNKERVEGSDIIGTHVDPSDGKKTETKKATIVYSKTGSHIIPRKDSGQ